jgi:ABC-type branched-subunit amino acid transport system ATPase component
MTVVILLGASGAGKTTIAETIASRYADTVEVFHFDRIGVPTLAEMIADYGSPEAWQRAKTFDWIFRLSAAARRGRHILFEGQTRFSSVSEAALAAGLLDHVAILVDCDDETRCGRLSIDRKQPELADRHMMDWARFLRTEATSGGHEILDTSAQSVDASARHVCRHFA